MLSPIQRSAIVAIANRHFDTPHKASVDALIRHGYVDRCPRGRISLTKQGVAFVGELIPNFFERRRNLT